ncbi:MAG: ATP-dependent zinc protease [Magnetococcales bacterium]|nr:ATP-dependent zinc protease [Magnetococcales bacterium]
MPKVTHPGQNVLWQQQKKMIIGWQEWVGLPALGIESIKAKIDTGARTSSLHAFELEPFEENKVAMVRFIVEPDHKSDHRKITCIAPLLDERNIRSSNGTNEKRYVVETIIKIGEQIWPIELTLSSREQMGFRMLIGRNAMRNRCLVDPNLSHKTRYAFHQERDNIISEDETSDDEDSI